MKETTYMFQVGKTFRVKIELSPETTTVGQAVIIESDRKRLFLQLKIDPSYKKILHKGNRLWFINSSLITPFKGLWTTTVLGVKMMHGKTVFECSRPRFESLLQRRKQKRLVLQCPVQFPEKPWQELSHLSISRNISHSGIGIGIFQECFECFVVGQQLDIIIESLIGPIAVSARIIQVRYNWLANRTDVGLEFVEVKPEVAAALDKLLVLLSKKPVQSLSLVSVNQHDKSLAKWLKSSPDKIDFVKIRSQSYQHLAGEETKSRAIKLNHEGEKPDA